MFYADGLGSGEKYENSIRAFIAVSPLSESFRNIFKIFEFVHNWSLMFW